MPASTAENITCEKYAFAPSLRDTEPMCTDVEHSSSPLIHAVLSPSEKPAPLKKKFFGLPTITVSTLPAVCVASMPVTAYTWKVPLTLSLNTGSVENW